VEYKKEISNAENYLIKKNQYFYVKKFAKKKNHVVCIFVAKVAVQLVKKMIKTEYICA